MGQLDASIVTLGLPSIQRQFHADLGAVTWVGLSYLLVLAASVVAVGRWSDLVGRKLLYLYGFVVFVTGSALCGFAPNLGALIGFRALQAVGAAMLQANSVAIITVAVDRRVLGRAIGIQGAAQALGLALGPSVGGVLLAVGGWRWLFWVNVPVGLIGLIAAACCVPRSGRRPAQARFDWLGFALFAPAVGLVLWVLSTGTRFGPWELGLLVSALVLAGAWVVHEHRTPSPLLDLSLFARGPFRRGITGGLLAYAVLFGLGLAVPFYVERGRGEGPGRAGAVLMAVGLTLGLVAPLAGRLADRWNGRDARRWLGFAGMVLAAAGLTALSVWRPSTTGFVVCLVVVGAGLGLFTPSNNASIMGSVPRSEVGAASGVLNMTRAMGTALGLALTAAVFRQAGGVQASTTAVAHGFSVAVAALGGLAIVSGLISGIGAGRSVAGVGAAPLSNRGGPG